MWLRLTWIVAASSTWGACAERTRVEPAPDGSAACAFGASVTAMLELGTPGPVPGGVDIAAAATVLDGPGLRLRGDDGRTVNVAFDVPGAAALAFQPGERVWAELAASGPFWVNYQIEIYALDAAGGAGELRLAVWWGERRLQAVRDWTLEIEDGGCDATDTCGAAVGSNLRVTAPAGGQAVLAPGETTALEGYRVANGRSWRYLSTIACTDTPPTWSGVSVVRM